MIVLELTCRWPKNRTTWHLRPDQLSDYKHQSGSKNLQIENIELKTQKNEHLKRITH